MRSTGSITLLLLLVLAATNVAGQTPAAPSFTKEDFTIPADDGVTLAATLYKPGAEGPYAAILLTHGWPEYRSIGHVTTRSERWASQGFLVVAYDSRGYGGSGGETTLDGPQEVADAQRFIDWIAARPDVRMETPEDPLLGMFGRSYAGGLAQLTAMTDPRVDALIPEITWNNLFFALVPNEVAEVGWINLLFAGGQAETHGIPAGPEPGRLNPDAQGGASSQLSEWYATLMATNEANEEMREEIGRVRSIDPGRIDVPTLLMQGFNDTLFDARHAARSFVALQERGVPSKLILFSGGHGVGFSWDSPQHQEIEARVDAWFRYHLRGESDSEWVTDWPVEHWYPWETRFQGEASWPPSRVRPTPYYLSGPEDASLAGGGSLQATPPETGETVRLAQLAAPTNYIEIPNFQSQTPSQEQNGPSTSVVFATEPLEAPQELLGAPLVYLTLSREVPNGEIIVMVRIIDIDPAGTSTTVLKQVTPTRLELPAAAAPATLVPVELAPLTHVFAKGHRIGIGITTNDPAFGGSREPNTVGIGTGPTGPSFAFLPLVVPGLEADPYGPDATIERLPPRATQGTTVTFQVTSSDNLRVTNLTVEVTNGATLLQNETFERPPRTVSAWFEAREVGTYVVRARVVDVSGHVSTTEETVEVRPPETVAGAESDEDGAKTPGLGFILALAGVLGVAIVRSRRKS